MKNFFKLKYMILIVLVAVLTSCGTSTTHLIDKSEILKKLRITDYPTKAEYPEADAVIIYEKVDFRNFISSTKSVHRILKVFNNFSEHGKLVIELGRGESYSDFAAKVTKPNGEVIAVDPKSFVYHKSENTKGNTFFESYTLNFPGIEENSVIEYSYKIDAKDYNNSGYYRVGSTEYPKLITSHTINVSKTSDVNLMSVFQNKGNKRVNGPIIWQPSNLAENEELKPKEIINDNLMSLTWEFLNVPKIKVEEYMPLFAKVIPSIQYYSFEIPTWEYVTAGYAYFLNKYFIPNDEVKAKANEITKNCKNDFDKITKIRDFVKDIEKVKIPESNDEQIERQKPQETLKKKAGTEFDIISLEIAMLNASNMSAMYALTEPSDEDEIKFDDPTFFATHIIAVETSDKQKVFIIPSIDFIKTGQLPWEYQGVNVVAVTSAGKPYYMTTPNSKSSDNILKLAADISETADGKYKYNVTITVNGVYDVIYRNRINKLAFEEINKYIETFVKNPILEPEITDIAFSDMTDANTPFVISFNFETDKLISNQGDISILNFDLFNNYIPDEWAKTNTREHSICLPFLFQIQKEFTIRFNKDNYKLSTAPKSLSKKDRFFDYNRFVFEAEPGTIKYTSTTTLNQKEFGNKDFEAAKSNLNQIKEYTQEKIILNNLVK